MVVLPKSLVFSFATNLKCRNLKLKLIRTITATSRVDATKVNTGSLELLPIEKLGDLNEVQNKDF